MGLRFAGVLTLYRKPSRDESPLLAPALPGLLSQSSRRAAGGYEKLATKVPSDGSDDSEHEATTNRTATCTPMPIARPAAVRAFANLVPLLVAKVRTTLRTSGETKLAEAPNLHKTLTCDIFCTACYG